MLKHVIINPFTFVGFELCMKLLEEGNEITGVHPVHLTKSSYAEEMEMLLGRNANFSLVDCMEIDQTDSDEYVLVICHRGVKTGNLSEMIRTVKIRAQDKIIIVLDLYKEAITELHEHQNQVTIIMPTVYGPRQPTNMVFQNSLLNREFAFAEYERENKDDAIYIGDAVTSIIELINHPPGKYKVQSSIENHWFKALSEIGYQVLFEEELRIEEISEEIQIHIAETTVTPKQGIEEQKQYNKLMEWYIYDD